jgi:hypothetical protein
MRRVIHRILYYYSLTVKLADDHGSKTSMLNIHRFHNSFSHQTLSMFPSSIFPFFRHLPNSHSSPLIQDLWKVVDHMVHFPFEFCKIKIKKITSLLQIAK